jgi:hypothetical protein
VKKFIKIVAAGEKRKKKRERERERKRSNENQKHTKAYSSLNFSLN